MNKILNGKKTMRVIDSPELGYYINIIANSRTCIENHLYIFFIVDIAKCTNYMVYGIRITEGKCCYYQCECENEGNKNERVYYVCNALLHRSNIIFFIIPARYLNRV